MVKVYTHGLMVLTTELRPTNKFMNQLPESWRSHFIGWTDKNTPIGNNQLLVKRLIAGCHGGIGRKLILLFQILRDLTLGMPEWGYAMFLILLLDMPHFLPYHRFITQNARFLKVVERPGSKI